MNLTDIPAIIQLFGQRNILGEIRRQYDQDGGICLAVLDDDGDPVGFLPFMASDHPEIGAMLSKAESDLHDQLTAAGVTVDEPLYEPCPEIELNKDHDDDPPLELNGQAGTAPRTIQRTKF